MNRIFQRQIYIFGLIGLFIAIASDASGIGNGDCGGNCVHYGNVLVTAEGVKQITQQLSNALADSSGENRIERAINEAVNARAQQYLKSLNQAGQRTTLLETNNNCPSPTPALGRGWEAEKTIASINKALSSTGECTYFPKTKSTIDSYAPEKFVRFRADATEFAIAKNSPTLTVENIVCESVVSRAQGQKCSTTFAVSNVDAAATVEVRDKDMGNDSTETLMAPSFRVASEKDRKVGKVTVDFFIRPSGQLQIQAQNITVNELNYDALTVTRQQKIPIKTATYMDINSPEAVHIQDEKFLAAKKESFDNLFSECGPVGGASFASCVRQVIELQLRSPKASSDLKDAWNASLDFSVKTMKNCTGGTRYFDCLAKANPNMKLQIELLPAVQFAAQTAQAKSTGINSPDDDKIINGLADIVKKGLHESPTLQGRLTSEIKAKALAVQGMVNEQLSNLLAPLPVAQPLDTQIPMLDPQKIIDINAKKKVGQENSDPYEKNKIEKEIRESKNEPLPAYNEQLKTIADFVDKTNRIGIFAAADCLLPNKISTSMPKLNGAPLGVEITEEGINRWLAQTFRADDQNRVASGTKRNSLQGPWKKLCVNSSSPKCDGGQWVQLKQAPVFNFTGDKNFKIDFGAADIDYMGNQSAQLSLTGTFGPCQNSSKDVCMTNVVPKFEVDSTAIKMGLRLAQVFRVDTPDVQAAKDFKKLDSVPLMSILPENLRRGFAFQMPVINSHDRTIVFPIEVTPSTSSVAIDRLASMK